MSFGESTGLRAERKIRRNRQAKASAARRREAKRIAKAERPKRVQVTCRCSAFDFPHRQGSEPGGKPWALGTASSREHVRKLREREKVTPHWRQAAGARRARTVRRGAPHRGRVQRGTGILASVRRAWDADDVPF